MQQLVKLEIKQALEKELDNYHELLLGALGRISCLEMEISDLKIHSSMPQASPQASPRGTVSHDRRRGMYCEPTNTTRLKPSALPALASKQVHLRQQMPV